MHWETHIERVWILMGLKLVKKVVDYMAAAVVDRLLFSVSLKTLLGLTMHFLTHLPLGLWPLARLPTEKILLGTSSALPTHLVVSVRPRRTHLIDGILRANEETLLTILSSLVLLAASPGLWIAMIVAVIWVLLALLRIDLIVVVRLLLEILCLILDGIMIGMPSEPTANAVLPFGDLMGCNRWVMELRRTLLLTRGCSLLLLIRQRAVLVTVYLLIIVAILLILIPIGVDIVTALRFLRAVWVLLLPMDGLRTILGRVTAVGLIRHELVILLTVVGMLTACLGAFRARMGLSLLQRTAGLIGLVVTAAAKLLTSAASVGLLMMMIGLILIELKSCRTTFSGPQSCLDVVLMAVIGLNDRLVLIGAMLIVELKVRQINGLRVSGETLWASMDMVLGRSTLLTRIFSMAAPVGTLLSELISTLVQKVVVFVMTVLETNRVCRWRGVLIGRLLRVIVSFYFANGYGIFMLLVGVGTIQMYYGRCRTFLIFY